MDVRPALLSQVSDVVFYEQSLRAGERRFKTWNISDEERPLVVYQVGVLIQRGELRDPCEYSPAARVGSGEGGLQTADERKTIRHAQVSIHDGVPSP